MKEVYIAYFDILGFDQFIENNSNEAVLERMRNVFRDLERINGGAQKYKFHQNEITRNFASYSGVNCLHLSNTIFFWTNDCDFNTLQELLRSCYHFFSRNLIYNFPLRGAICKGDIRLLSDINRENNGSTYAAHSLYGKGVVKAKRKAKSQVWAGTVIADQVVADLMLHENSRTMLSEFAVKYKVPYKDVENQEEEYVLRPIKQSSSEGAKERLQNTKNLIAEVIAQDNKLGRADELEKKIKNTLAFIDFLAE